MACRLRLHPEVTVRIEANVARSAEEAEMQAKTGRAVSRTDEEEDEPAYGAEPGAEHGAEDDAFFEAEAGGAEEDDHADDLSADGEPVAAAEDDDLRSS